MSYSKFLIFEIDAKKLRTETGKEVPGGWEDRIAEQSGFRRHEMKIVNSGIFQGKNPHVLECLFDFHCGSSQRGQGLEAMRGFPPTVG